MLWKAQFSIKILSATVSTDLKFRLYFTLALFTYSVLPQTLLSTVISLIRKALFKTSFQLLVTSFEIFAHFWSELIVRWSWLSVQDSTVRWIFTRKPVIAANASWFSVVVQKRVSTRSQVKNVEPSYKSYDWAPKIHSHHAFCTQYTARYGLIIYKL